MGLAAGGGSDRATVYVAVPTAGVAHNLALLTVGLVISVPPAVALLTGVVWMLTGRALRPVEDLRAQTAEITAGDLGRRLDVPPADDALDGWPGPSTTCSPGWTTRHVSSAGSSRTPPTSCAVR